MARSLDPNFSGYVLTAPMSSATLPGALVQPHQLPSRRLLERGGSGPWVGNMLQGLGGARGEDSLGITGNLLGTCRNCYEFLRFDLRRELAYVALPSWPGASS